MSSEVSSICVLRSTGIKDEITCSLKGTLRDLKVAISQSTALGMIPVDRQRIFHLGRELKTPGRSLEALGVGRFQGLNKTVIHVHATPSDSATNPTVTTVNTVQMAAPRLRGCAPLARLSTGGSRSTSEPRLRRCTPLPRYSTVGPRSTSEPEVVNLESDDDDDEVVTIDVDSTTSQQKKRRRRT